MTDVRGLPFSLDPLMAEAKRRMWRRRVGLVVIASVAVAAALVLTVQPWGGRGHAQGVGATRTAIAHIPGMTRVQSTPISSVCGNKSSPPWLPRWCTSAVGRYEAWILTTGYKQGFRQNASPAFAAAHPGPVIVLDTWWRVASPQQAKQLLREHVFTRTSSGLPGRPMWRTHPAPAINGGIAHSSLSFYFGQSGARVIEYFWASGSTVVNVYVTGDRLTSREAQKIALLARPR
jgi:hypothetical protein